MLPCGSQPTSVGRQKMYFCAGGFGPVRRRDGAVNRRRPAAEHHQHLALRAELGDHVGAFVDGPDVVVLVDAHRVGEFEAVIALADFLDEVAVLVELPQPRVGAAVIDEDVALGIGRDGDRFAEILAGRELQEVRHRRVAEFPARFVPWPCAARTQARRTAPARARKRTRNSASFGSSQDVFRTKP